MWPRLFLHKQRIFSHSQGKITRNVIKLTHGNYLPVNFMDKPYVWIHPPQRFLVGHETLMGFCKYSIIKIVKVYF